MGHIEVKDARLRLEAPSRTRLATGRGLLESHAGSLLKHTGDSFTSVEDVKQRVLSGQRSPEPPSSIPPDIEREAIRAFKAQHYADWPDHPLPALGGKTARQAVRSREGRKQVVELLRTMQNDEERTEKGSGMAFDFNILRRDLGLEEE
jgi:hypothetical protein